MAGNRKGLEGVGLRYGIEEGTIWRIIMGRKVCREIMKAERIMPEGRRKLAKDRVYIAKEMNSNQE